MYPTFKVIKYITTSEIWKWEKAIISKSLHCKYKTLYPLSFCGNLKISNIKIESRQKQISKPSSIQGINLTHQTTPVHPNVRSILLFTISWWAPYAKYCSRNCGYGVFFFNTGQTLIRDVYILARETENKRYKYGKYIVCKNAVSDKKKLSREM